MNKTIYRLLCVMLAVTASLAGHSAPLPQDPELRLGTLPCGITYYIRHNGYPQGRAEMWMVHRVGSVVETDNEQGYAHFLEHLAFNGSTHFPEQEMVHYLTGIGMSYGSDINASTGYDDTQYQLSNVPTASWTALDSALLALSDLAGSLTLDNKAIEKEKAIIEEEWRHRGGYAMRMFDAVMPQLLGSSPYATRVPIGKMHIVRQADHQSLMRFYRHWFRPELQAVVIVGDFDAAIMEQHVRQAFATVTRPSTPCPNPEVAVTRTEGLRFAHYSDAEALGTTVRLLHTIAMPAHEERNTMEWLQANTLRQLVTMMLNERLDERTRTAGSTMLSTACVIDKFLSVGDQDALTITTTGDNPDCRPLLTELLTEVQRVAVHGFSADELGRAAARYRAATDAASMQVEQHPSRDYVDEYIDHFLHGGYLPGVVQECRAIAQVLDTVTTASVNQMAQQLLAPSTLNVVVTNTDAAAIPTQAEVEGIASRVRASRLEPSEAMEHSLTPDNGNLMPSDIAAGLIVDEHTDTTTGITTMRLSNGATVQLMPSTLQRDEVLFDATRPGGMLDCGEGVDNEVRLIDDVVENSALGLWDQSALRKRLSGTPLALTYSLGESEDNLSGNCRTADLETLLQLNHLYFTAVAPDTAAYATLRRQLMAMAKQQRGTPEAVMADSIAATLYQHHPSYRPLTETDITATNFDDVLALYRQRVAPAQLFTFTLVGDFNLEQVRPLIERYIASLPSTGETTSQHSGNTPSPPYPTGDIDNVFLQAMSSPKASIYACMMGDMQYNLKNRLLIDVAGQVLAVAMNAHLREDLKATYGVDASGAASRTSNKWMLMTQFDTQPELTQTILGEVARVFDVIMSYGTTPELLQHIRQQMLQQLDSDQRTIAYWLAVLHDRAMGFDSHTGYRELVESLTIDQVNQFITQLYPTMRMRVVMQGYPKF